MISTTNDNHADCKISAKRFKGVGHCHNRTHFYRARRDQKTQICRWNFDPTCLSSRDISTSGFGGHIAISGCRSLSQSPRHTIFELAEIEYLKSAVGISILTDVVLGIKLFPVLAVTLPFPISIIVSVACVQLLRARLLAMVNKARSSVGISLLSSIFLDMCISVLAAIFPFPVVGHCINSPISL